MVPLHTLSIPWTNARAPLSLRHPQEQTRAPSPTLPTPQGPLRTPKVIMNVMYSGSFLTLIQLRLQQHSSCALF